MDLQKEEWEGGIKCVIDRPCVFSFISIFKFFFASSQSILPPVQI